LLRATVATINMDKLDHWLKMPTIDFSFHGNDGRFPGMDGDIPAGSEFVVLPSTAEDGFIRFFGEGAAPDERMSSLGDDTPIITREELGDLDPKKWPPGLDDQPQDPWQKQMKIAMVDRNGNDIYRFVAHNMVSIIAVRQLLGRIRFNPKGKAGWLPVIRLGVVEYFNKKYRCKKPKPVLGVVDWIAPDADGSAVPASPSTDNNRDGRLPPSGSEEFTDEILF